MLITEQSLVETLDGRAGDPRRRCRLFIPHPAVFIPNQLLFSPRLVCSHPVYRWPGEAGHPAAGVIGDHGGMELKPEPSRPAVLATGIIDGMPCPRSAGQGPDDRAVVCPPRNSAPRPATPA